VSKGSDVEASRMLIGLRLKEAGAVGSGMETLSKRGAVVSDMAERCCAWFGIPGKIK